MFILKNYTGYDFIKKYVDLWFSLFASCVIMFYISAE